MAVIIPAIDTGDCNNMIIESIIMASLSKKLVNDFIKADILKSAIKEGRSKIYIIGLLIRDIKVILFNLDTNN